MVLDWDFCTIYFFQAIQKVAEGMLILQKLCVAML